MAISLNAEQERIVKEELSSGQYTSAEEVISQALSALREQVRNNVSMLKEERKRAVQSLLEFAEKNRTRLQDISIKDLLHEGHRL